MDSSLMKFLEEDEDETMHSGADVAAFTAALNRDIEGKNTSTSQPLTHSDAGGALSQGNNHNSSQLFQQWQSSHEGNAGFSSSKEEVHTQIQEQHSSTMEINLHGSGSENQHQSNDTLQEMSRLPLQPSIPQDDFQQHRADQHNIHIKQTRYLQNTEKGPGHLHDPNKSHNSDNESQYQRMHVMGNQQTMTAGQTTNAMNRPTGKQVPFALLLPVIEPQLDKDKAMQLRSLYVQLKNNNLNKDEFVRQIRTLVGDHMLKIAVYKLQQGQAASNLEKSSNQFPNSAQNSVEHNIQKPSYVPSSSIQQPSDSSSVAMDNDAQKSRYLEYQSDSHGIQAGRMSYSNHGIGAIKQERDHSFLLQGIGKQQQQHMHFQQTSFPTYGNNGANYHPYSNTNMNMSTHSLKQQTYDLQMRQGPIHPSMGATQIGTNTQAMNQMPSSERQNSFTDLKRMHGGSLTHFTSSSALQQNSAPWQSSIHKDQSLLSSMAHVKQESIDQINDQRQKSQLSTPQGPSSFPSEQLEQETAIAGPPKNVSSSISEPMSITAQLERQNELSSRIQSAAKTPPKKPSIAQKKPSEPLGFSQPPSSKKQKVSGAFSDQSIEQLNDVTAVSGVNLREEEEQLFSGSKEDSRVSEASRKVVQEEEERLILQKVPLQKKLAEIMGKSGVKNRSNDVERCLSLCVEERMRGLISNLIRLSKQRGDIEKPRDGTVVTSDVRQHILSMNQKAREEWEKKQADAEKLQRSDDPEGSDGVDEDGKSSKVNKEEDDKMRTTAANVAARAAVGGDDMLSKWQLMAEQARQKREGGIDVPSTSQPNMDVGSKPVSTSGRNSKDNQDTEKRSTGAVVDAKPGSIRKSVRNQDSGTSGAPCNISIKDVINILEREVQMSKSTLLYRLYEKVRSDAGSDSPSSDK